MFLLCSILRPVSRTVQAREKWRLEVSFSASQWLASFALDALIKSFLITFIGVLVTFTSPFPFLFAAICLSIFHFICLFLGYTAVVAFELIRIEFGPRLKFWLGLLLANILFGALLNTFMALDEAHKSPPAVLELSPVTVVLVATNLMPIFLVLGCSYIARCIKRSCASRAAII